MTSLRPVLKNFIRVIVIALLLSCSEDDPVQLPEPVAAFEYSFGDSPRSIIFTNASIEANEYSWDFGDGNQSDLVDPTHTYETDGNYTVVLTARNAVGVEDSFEIQLTISSPMANFTYDVNGFTVQFSNSSTNYSSISWDFGDESETSNDENPIHTYYEGGTYQVVLTVTDALGFSTNHSVDVVIESIQACERDAVSTDWSGRDTEWVMTFDRFPVAPEFGSGITSIVEPNPHFNNNLNSSCGVNKLVRPEDDPYYGVQVYYSDIFSGENIPLDLSSNKVFSLDVYFQNAGTFSLIVKSADGSGDISVVKEISDDHLNRWTMLVFDLTDMVDDRVLYNALELRVNDGQSAGWTMYFDNLSQRSSE